MPAAAVIPVPIVYVEVIAVKIVSQAIAFTREERTGQLCIVVL